LMIIISKAECGAPGFGSLSRCFSMSRAAGEEIERVG